MNKKLVPVSERALMARVNRKLKINGMALKRCKVDSPWREKLGKFYVVDIVKDQVESTGISLIRLAKELKALKHYESLFLEAT